MTTKTTAIPRLLTFRQFAERHQPFSEASLRWLRFKRHQNGYSNAFRRIGRRVYIDERRFFEILEAQNGVLRTE